MANLPGTLVDILYEHCNSEKNGQNLYSFWSFNSEESVDTVTYLMLENKARKVAAFIQQWQQENRATDCILLLYPPGLDYIAAFFGCLLAGVPAVPLYPPDFKRQLDRFIRVVKDSGANLALTNEKTVLDYKKIVNHSDSLQNLNLISSSTLLDFDENLYTHVNVKPTDLAFVQYTSGSTSEPKGVMLNHDNLVNNLSHISSCFDLERANTIGASWLPPYHDMGLIGGVLSPMVFGFPVHLMSPVDFIKKPVRWLELISKQKVTSSGGPDFAYNLCSSNIPESRIEQLNLKHWRLAFTGAEPVRASTIEKFSKRFQDAQFQPDAFFPCYGLAESTLLVAGRKPAAGKTDLFVDTELLNQSLIKKSSSSNGYKLISNGAAIENHLVKIVNPDSCEICGSDEVGEIWVQGRSVACGYWNNADLSKKVFSAQISGHQSDGYYLRTGDMGCLIDDQLYITGRLKDIIVIRGRNYYPQDIEITVEECHAALRSNGCVAFSIDNTINEELIVVQEINPTFKSKSAAIELIVREAIMEKHDLRVSVVLLVKPRSIPKTSSGKVQRAYTKRLYEIGQLDGRSVSKEKELKKSENIPDQSTCSSDVIHDGKESYIATSEGPIVMQVRNAVASMLDMPADALDDEKPLARYGFDSILSVNMLHWVEEMFAVEIDVPQQINELNLAEISLLIEDKLSQISSAKLVQSSSSLQLQEIESSNRLLTTGQQAVWVQHRISKPNTSLNIGAAVEIVGDIDIEHLIFSISEVVLRHQSFALNIRVDEGVPEWFGRHDIDPDITVINKNQSDAEIESVLNKAHNRPFDLNADALIRVNLYNKENRSYVLQVVAHHIVADMWSLATLFQQFLDCYQRSVPHSPDSQKIVTARQDSMLAYFKTVWGTQVSLDKQKADRAYWEAELSGEMPLTVYPYDNRVEKTVSSYGSEVQYDISQQVSKTTKELAARLGTTVFTVVLTAFQAFLSGCLQEDNVTIGTPVANRRNRASRNLIAYLVNPIPIRSRHFDGDTFLNLIERTKLCLQMARLHDSISLQEMMSMTESVRNAQTPLYRIMFSNLQMSDVAGVDISPFTLNRAGYQRNVGGLTLRSMKIQHEAVQYDLNMTLGEIDGLLCGSMQFNTDLYKRETIERFNENFCAFLERLVVATDVPISSLELISLDESVRLQSYSSGASLPISDKTIDQLFVDQVRATPDKCAIVCNGKEKSYQQLLFRVGQIAEQLLNNNCVAGESVSIIMQRSTDMVAAVLAVLRCGCAYIPLDPEFPRHRIDLILSKTATRIVLTESCLEESLVGLDHSEIICVDKIKDSKNAVLEQQTHSSNNLAYVIFTSGSTGEPKGVMIEHGNVVAFFQAMSERIPFKQNDKLLAVSSLSFDISVLEILWPLTCGMSIILQSDARQIDYSYGGDADSLLGNIEKYKPTHMQCTPSYLQTVLKYENAANALGVFDVLMLGGESLPEKLAEDLLAGFDCRIFNMYGPTETTIWSSTFELSQDDVEKTVSIGRPIPNTNFFVLDRFGRQLPLLCPGELHIGGAGLARGYYENKAATSLSFRRFKSGLSEDTVLYKTGDIVRYDYSGNLFYLNRSDAQLKIRGYRIEPSEIEFHLQSLNGVLQAIVISNGDVNNPLLLAFIVTNNVDPAISEAEIRFLLSDKLPVYMIPSAFVFLETMPKTPNDKIDKLSLLQKYRKSTQQQKTVELPAGELEVVISDIVKNVFSVDSISVIDNLFEIGGNSMLLMQLHAQLNKHADINVELSDLFQYSTIREISQHLEKAKVPFVNAQDRSVNSDVGRSSRRQSARVRRKKKGLAGRV